MRFPRANTVTLLLVILTAGCATRSPVVPGMNARFTKTDSALETNDPNYHTTLQVRWLGTACYLIQLGDKAILTDPFLSHHSMLRAGLGGELKSDSAKVRSKLTGAPVPAAMFIGHSHYDHSLDAAECLRLPGWQGVPIYGSDSTSNILCGYSSHFTSNSRSVITNSDWQVITEGIRYKAVRVTHARQSRYLPLLYPGKVEKCLHKPHKRACDFQLGGTYAFQFELSNAHTTNRVYFIGAAHHDREGFAESNPVDVAILCVPSWKNVSGYPRGVIARHKPRHIIASHYNDFFQVNDKPFNVVPLADLDGFLRAVQEAANYQRFRSLWLPSIDAVVRFEPGGK